MTFLVKKTSIQAALSINFSFASYTSPQKHFLCPVQPRTLAIIESHIPAASNIEAFARSGPI